MNTQWKAIPDITQDIHDNQVEGVCPRCEGLAYVTVETSGYYNNANEGEIHWFSGTAECSECDWRGEYSDSS